MNQLVKGAVGFNEERGDVVTVVATKFEPQIDPNAIPWYRDENYQTLTNAAVVGAIFFGLLSEVLRQALSIQEIIYGAILMAFMMFKPRGLFVDAKSRSVSARGKA